MLPVVAEPTVVARQIVAYSWALVAASLLLWAVAPMTWFYGAVALVAGGTFLVEAHALQRRVRSGAGDLRAMRLFHGSITYLTVVFLAVALDPLLPT
jgi:protoheme IX farnesyltransferase